jgi:hypothetical protein
MRDRVVLVGGAVLALLLIAGSLERARPEVYNAGGAGMTFPLDLRHVRGTGAIMALHSGTWSWRMRECLEERSDIFSKTKAGSGSA